MSSEANGTFNSLLNTSTTEGAGSGSSGSSSHNSSFSSSVAHRGPYSKPPCLNNSRPQNARFTPYTRKPIYVGARRVGEDDEIEPHLTSTAQRMIEILQKNTTPVVEGIKKVAIHSPGIKSLRPNLVSRRSFPGPPIHRSPFAFDGMPVNLPVAPKFLMSPKKGNALPPVTLPQSTPLPTIKTSPFAPLPIGSIAKAQTFDYDAPKSSGGGKIKSKLSRMHEPSPQPITLLQPQKMERSSALVSKMNDTRFTFSKAWSSADYNPSQTRLVNGVEKEEDDSFWKQVFLIHLPKNGAKDKEPPPKPSTWTCPTCMVSNKVSSSECVCCTEPRPSSFDAGDGSLKALKTESAAPKFSFGFTSTSAVSTPATVSNPLPIQAASSTWPCPTCMVTNDVSSPECVCCTEPRPASYKASSETSKKLSSKSEPKIIFGVKPSASDSKSVESQPTFKFGFTSSPVTSTTTSKTEALPTFKFGFTPNVTSASTAKSESTLDLGIKTSVPTTSVSKGDSLSTFKFGFNPTSTASSVVSTTTPNTTSSLPPSPFRSTLSADAFRKGFGFLTTTSTTKTTATVTTSSLSPIPSPSSTPSPPVVKQKQSPSSPDDEIEKYKFPPFFGGPKPPLPQPSKPSAEIPKTVATSAPVIPPISFGTFLTTANGGPVTTPAALPTSAPSSKLFSFPSSPTTTSEVSVAASTPSIVTTTSSTSIPTPAPFSFGTTFSTHTISNIPSSAGTGFVFGANATASPPMSISSNAVVGEKRKASDAPEGTFLFHPSEPKLKMKAEGTASPSPAPPVNFLNAMKQPSFGSTDRPDGALNTFGSLPSTNTNPTPQFNNPNPGIPFQMNAVQPPPSTSGFNFANASQQPATGGGLFPFGQQQQPSGGNIFQAATPFTPNMVPNLVFGQSPGGTGPVLFSAGAPPPSQASGEGGRRPTKRAVRRLR